MSYAASSRGVYTVHVNLTRQLSSGTDQVVVQLPDCFHGPPGSTAHHHTVPPLLFLGSAVPTADLVPPWQVLPARAWEANEHLNV